MPTARANLDELSSKSKFDAISISLYKLITIAAILSVSGCQYFNFGQPMAFSASNSGNAALINLKSNQVVRTKIVPHMTTSVSLNPYLGNASHVCGPSGFGQQSHCFMRGPASAGAQNI